MALPCIQSGTFFKDSHFTLLLHKLFSSHTLPFFTPSKSLQLSEYLTLWSTCGTCYLQLKLHVTVIYGILVFETFFFPKWNEYLAPGIMLILFSGNLSIHLQIKDIPCLMKGLHLSKPTKSLKYYKLKTQLIHLTH